MKTTIDWDFPRGGRIAHAWDGQTVNSIAGRPVGAGDIPVTLCGLAKVKQSARYISVGDKRCPKCREIAQHRIAALTD